jgi:DNA-binding MarR family transcriptional regulator
VKPKPPQPRVRGLAAELNKKKPFDLPEQEAWLSLLRTTSILAQPIEQLFKVHGLSESTYNALRILRASSDGRPCSEVGRDLVARVPDVTRLIDRLEKAGLATRSRETADRRVVNIRITDKGLALLAKLDQPLRDLHKQQFEPLTRAELAELIRVLQKLRHSGTART